MRGSIPNSGLLVSLIVTCVGACTAKQRDFMANEPSPDATETQPVASSAPNPAPARDAGFDAGATTAPGTPPPDASSEGPRATSWSPESSTAAPEESSSVESAPDTSSSSSAAPGPSSADVDSSSSSVPNDTSPPTLWDDLVLHLTMDDAEWTAGGAVYDGSPAQNHGTLNGSVTQTADGKFDKAAVFDGDGWITVPDSDSLDASTELTLSAWVNFGYVGGGYSPGIISKRLGFNDNTAYALFLWDQNKVWVDVDYETDRFGSSAVFETNRWYHLAVVYDGKAQTAERVRLYVDGNLDTIASETSGEIPAYGCDLEVGRLVNGGHTMIGMIDEVAVWRRALGADEIALISQAALQ